VLWGYQLTLNVYEIFLFVAAEKIVYVLIGDQFCIGMRSISLNSGHPEGFNLPVDGLPAGSSIMQHSSGMVVHPYYLAPLPLPPERRETEPPRVRKRIPRVQFGTNHVHACTI